MSGTAPSGRTERYCTAACRQAAWRARSTHASIQAVTTITARGRREVTVYACSECEQRYLGQQWCDDCNRPCVHVGLGGLTPCCQEPLTTDELLDRNSNT